VFLGTWTVRRSTHPRKTCLRTTGPGAALAQVLVERKEISGRRARQLLFRPAERVTPRARRRREDRRNQQTWAAEIRPSPRPGGLTRHLAPSSRPVASLCANRWVCYGPVLGRPACGAKLAAFEPWAQSIDALDSLAGRFGFRLAGSRDRH